MKSPRISAGRRAARFIPILSTSILALTAPWLTAANPDTWNLFSGSGQWSVGANWVDLSAPFNGDPTADLTFGGTTSYTANNDITGFFLNTLTLNAAVAETITGKALDFRTDDTAASITQSGLGTFAIGNDIILSAPLTLTGTSALASSAVTLNGLISGTSGMTFNGGYWQLGNLNNNFSGAATINTGAYVELIPSGAAPQNVSLAAGTGLLGSSVLTINGGTLKLTSKTTGTVTLGRAVTFGPSGGLLDITNTSGTAGVAGGNIATTAGGDISITSNASAGAAAVVRFNGGQLGLSDNNAVNSNLNTGGNTLRFNSINGAGAIRVEITNGALARAGNGGGGTVTIANPWTYRGVAGGDPTSGITGSPALDGKTSTAITLNTGRVAVDNASIINYTGGLTFEDAVLVGLTGGSRALDGNITIAGTASGHPGYVAFSGRATGTALSATLNAPGGTAIGQNPIYIGQNADDTFTVQDGGIAVLDLRVRTDQVNNNAVVLNAQAVLNPGASLRLYQSLSANSRFTAPGGAPNPAAASYVGNDIIQGNIVGQGTTAKESAFDIYLPAAVDLSVVQIFGGVDFQSTSNIVVNGSGFGGLRVSAFSRPNILFSGATPDPVSNDLKLDNYLTATRLAAVTGTGGYLTPSAANATFNFPNGGEWASAQPVGLKVIRANLNGPDVSLGALTAFNHNVALGSGAILDTGAAPFTFGSTQAVTLSGSGVVSGGGGIIIAAGSTLAPGFGIGTLNVGNITLNGTYQYEAANTPASDLLGVAGNLLLGSSSVLSFPVGNTFTNSTDYIIATYSGTLTGTFGIVPTLPAGFSLSYGTLSNSVIKLVSTSPTDTWNGTLNGKWDTTTANWKTNAFYSNGHKALFDDTATGTKAVVISGGDVNPSRVTVDTAGNYTITGTAGNAIIGTATLVKSGAGTLVLSGPHTFSGGISINTGTLKTGSTNSLPDTGLISIAAGSALDTQGFSDAVASLSVDGAVNGVGTLTVGSLVLGSGALFSPNLVLNGNLTKGGANPTTLAGAVNLGGAARTFTVAAGTGPELALPGVISNGSLIKAGDGALVLGNAANTFAGGVVVNAGTLLLGTPGALVANSTVVINGGTLDTNNTSLSVPSLSGTGGTLNLGSGSLAVAQSTNTIFTGAIIGGATTSITKTLAGVLNLNGPGSSYGGGLVINGGTVIAGAAGAAGSGLTVVNPGTTFQVGAALNNAITLAGGRLSSQGSPGQVTSGELTVTANSTVLLADSLTPASNSEVILTGALRGSGNLSVLAGTANGAPDGGPGFRLRGGQLSDYTGTITAGPSAKLEIQSGITDFNPAGSAKFVMTAGTYTAASINGNYSVINLRNNSGGNTSFANDYAIAGTGYALFNTPGSAPNGSVISLGKLNIGANQSVGVYRNTGNIQSVRFNSVVLGGGTSSFVANPIGFNVTGNTNLILGAISETAAANIVLIPGASNAAISSNVTLSAANSYSGSTTLLAGSTGTVFLGAAGALPVTTALIVDAGTIDFNNVDASSDQTIASLAGVGGFITNSDAVNTRTLTVNQSTNTTYSGTLTGLLALTKQGPGSLTLASANSFSGATTVTAGTLVVNGSLNGSAASITGGQFQGIGSVGALNLNGGALAPGSNGSGVLNTGALALAGGTLALELGGNAPGNYDQLNVAGSVTLSNPVLLTLDFSTYNPVDFSDTFIIVNNDSTDPVVFGAANARLFNGAQRLDEGSVFNLTSGAISQRFQITYAGGSNANDIVLIAVPEPGALGLLLGALGLLGGMKRLRMKVEG